MARIGMFGEAPSLVADGIVILDGVPSSSTRVDGRGTTPQGNTSMWAHRILESRDRYPILVAKQFPTPVSEAWFRFHWYGNGFNRANLRRLWGLRLGQPLSSVPILNIMQRDYGNTTFCGIDLVSANGIVLQQSVANVMNLAAVHLIEMHVVLDGVNGLCEIWIDGTLHLSYSGSLIGPGAETTFDVFCWGAGRPGGVSGVQDPGLFDPGVSATANTSARYTIDNFALNDTTGTVNNGRIGDGIILRLVPNGNGSFSQLTNSAGSSVDNFKHALRGAEGWVFPTAAGQRDSYLMSRPDKEFGGVNALMWQALVQANGPLANNVRFSLKPNGQLDFQSAAVDPVPVDAVTDIDADSPIVQRIVEVNPNTGAGFTIAEIDGCEAGLAFEA